MREPSCFCAVFVYVFRAALKAYLTSLIPSTTTPGPSTPPTNSRRTKQYIYICIDYILFMYILYYIYTVYINKKSLPDTHLKTRNKVFWKNINRPWPIHVGKSGSLMAFMDTGDYFFGLRYLRIRICLWCKIKFPNKSKQMYWPIWVFFGLFTFPFWVLFSTK